MTDLRDLIANLREQVNLLVPDDRTSGHWQLGFYEGREAAAKLLLDAAERGLDSEIVIAGMQGTIDGIRSQLAAVTAERDRQHELLKRMELDAIAALAGAGICTPVEGFVKAPHCLADCIERLAAERDSAVAELTRLRGEQAAIDAEIASEPPPKQVTYPLNCEVCGGPIKYFVEVCQIPDGHGVHVLHVGCWKMLDFPITGVAFNSAIEARRLAQGDAK